MNYQALTPLVIKAQQGDKNAMNDLVGACYNDIYYYVLKTVKKEDLAADVTQESFLEIITTLGKLREPEAFPLWARRIAYHKCALHFRNSKEVLLEEDEDGETLFDRLPDDSEDALPEQVLEDREFRKTIMDMINSLPSEQTNALLLYYYEKLSVGEIAEIQGTTAGTVKSRLNYARKAIKGKVEEYEKKTGTKLHSIAILPLLLRFLFESEASARPILSVPAPLLASAGASAASGAAGTVVASGAAKAVAIPLAVKIVGGVVAASIAIGGTAYGISRLTNKSDETGKVSGIQESTSEPQYIEAGNQSVWSEPESGIGDESEPSAPTEVSGTGNESDPSTPTEVSGTGNESDPSAPTEESGIGGESEPSTPTEEGPEERPSEGLEFVLNGDGTSYSVNDMGSCTDTTIVIPASYNGLPVTGIESMAFYYCRQLTKITIPGSVKTVGSGAFQNCEHLTNITFSGSLTSIGAHAFRSCTSLKSVSISGSSLLIDDYAFIDCTSLKSVSISGSVGTIKESAFAGCTSLTDVTIPDGVISLGKGAFSDCTSLTTITIPKGVTGIESGSFSNCKSLSNVTIPDSVTGIGTLAFHYCENLTAIAIPKSVTNIESLAFSYCENLTDITYHGTKKEWESIEKGRSWDNGIPAYTVHCTDGDIAKSG